MTQKRKIPFTKMQGAGNDYIYVYTPNGEIPDPSRTSIEWSRPHFGIGSDGLILISPSPIPEADFSMRIFSTYHWLDDDLPLLFFMSHGAPNTV